MTYYCNESITSSHLRVDPNLRPQYMQLKGVLYNRFKELQAAWQAFSYSIITDVFDDDPIWELAAKYGDKDIIRTIATAKGSKLEDLRSVDISTLRIWLRELYPLCYRSNRYDIIKKLKGHPYATTRIREYFAKQLDEIRRYLALKAASESAIVRPSDSFGNAKLVKDNSSE